jgi:hypothetical protein
MKILAEHHSMKYQLLVLTAALGLASCSSTGGDARLAAAGSLALSYAEMRGVITPAEAALARASGRLILAPVPVVVAGDAAPSK